MTTDIELTPNEIYDLTTNFTAGDTFLIQNFTRLPLQITEQASTPDAATVASFSVPVGRTWSATMPATGSIYLFSSSGGVVTVGAA